MLESTTIIAFDQHAQSVMAAVLGPHEAEPVEHYGCPLPQRRS